jgi:hypothetical protein
VESVKTAAKVSILAVFATALLMGFIHGYSFLIVSIWGIVQ